MAPTDDALTRGPGECGTDRQDLPRPATSSLVERFMADCDFIVFADDQDSVLEAARLIDALLQEPS